MTQSFSKEKLMNKWSPILDSIGVTGSKANWMAEYAQLHEDKQSKRNDKIDSVLDESETTNFPSILPLAMKIASKTVALDIVSVVPLGSPMGGTSQEEMERIEAEIKAENREGKIESILEDKEFKEKEVKDHPDYKGPMNIFYIDYSYGGATSSVDTIDKLK